VFDDITSTLYLKSFILLAVTPVILATDLHSTTAPVTGAVSKVIVDPEKEYVFFSWYSPLI
jgi:hypothetical protein